MKCKCQKCGYAWNAKGGKTPQSCARCKSYTWNKKKIRHRGEVISSGCTVCKESFDEGDTVYRVQEGVFKNGLFVTEKPEQQGIYCSNCIPDEEVLPFS